VAQQRKGYHNIMAKEILSRDITPSEYETILLYDWMDAEVEVRASVAVATCGDREYLIFAMEDGRYLGVSENEGIASTDEFLPNILQDGRDFLLNG
jgi:hypothetical protein